jgi:hypothetical protein
MFSEQVSKKREKRGKLNKKIKCRITMAKRNTITEERDIVAHLAKLCIN